MVGWSVGWLFFFISFFLLLLRGSIQSSLVFYITINFAGEPSTFAENTVVTPLPVMESQIELTGTLMDASVNITSDAAELGEDGFSDATPRGTYL